MAHPSAGAWAHEVLGALQNVFQSERAVITLGGPDHAVVAAADVSGRALAEYEAEFALDDGAGDLVASLDTPYYVEGDLAGHPAFRAHASSPVYNEWYRPHGLTDALGMYVVGSPRHVPDLYARLDVSIVANVLLAASPFSVGAGADQARGLLAVLHPALSAAVETLQRAGGAGAQVGAAVDGLDAAAWLFDADGRLLHTSAAAARWGTAAGAVLAAAAERLAQSLVQAWRRNLPAEPLATVTVGGRLVTLVGTDLRPWSRRDPAVLVSVPAPPRPNADDLRRRFGLTPRQAEVAALLAERRSNREIAEALHISSHTARHHTQAVLEALGVDDRLDVAAALRSE